MGSEMCIRDRNYTLRVDLGDCEGNSAYAEYSDFKVASAAEKYELTSLGTYSGNASTTMIIWFSLRNYQFISEKCIGLLQTLTIESVAIARHTAQGRLPTPEHGRCQLFLSGVYHFLP